MALLLGEERTGLAALLDKEMQIQLDKKHQRANWGRRPLTRSQVATRLLARDATRLPANADAPFDLIFLDPPYGKSLGQKALASAVAGGWIAPGALIVWEENAPQPAPPGFTLLDTRKYGETHVTFLEPEA